MAKSFQDMAMAILQSAKKPLTVAEIWEHAESKGLHKGIGITGKTPWSTLSSRLYKLTKDGSGQIARVGTKPFRYVIKSKLDQQAEDAMAAEQSVADPPLERELHDTLVYVLWDKLRLRCVRIRESVSKKGPSQRSLKWEHPDFVGASFLFDAKSKLSDLSEISVLSARKAMGGSQVKLVSIELKRELTRSNLRQCFFQALSNSHWANEAYLAVGDNLLEGDDMEDLREMCRSHGLGVIVLDRDDPEQSEMLVSAAYRDELQWTRIHKLAHANEDFREFIKRVGLDLAAGSVAPKQYYSVPALEDLGGKPTPKSTTTKKAKSG